MTNFYLEQADEGKLFPTLEIKKRGIEHLEKNALEGVKVIDTEEGYELMSERFPEKEGNERELIPNSGPEVDRWELIGDHYKKKHSENNGKAVCVIVSTHQNIIWDTPV